MELVNQEQIEATLLLKDIVYPFDEYRVGEGKIYLKTEEGSLKPLKFTKAVVKEVNSIHGKHSRISWQKLCSNTKSTSNRYG